MMTGAPSLHSHVLTHTADDAVVQAYWGKRAVSYSCGVCEELAGEMHAAWAAVLDEKTRSLRAAAASQNRHLRALDVGCGPGFFSILLSSLGCEVVAIDSSEDMLAAARRNAERDGASSIRFLHADAMDLSEAASSFDAIVSRNVTWLMKDLLAAYEEWQGLLRSGGKLLAFDANWYRYLVDPAVNARRLADQAPSTDILGWDEDSLATDAQERACEQIALALPSTYLLRPYWDVHVLRDLGFSDVSVDVDALNTLWTAGGAGLLRLLSVVLDRGDALTCPGPL